MDTSYTIPPYDDLAYLAKVGCPESYYSAGADFLRDVATDARLAYEAREEHGDWFDEAWEMTAALTHRLKEDEAWRAFTDLKGWAFESDMILQGEQSLTDQVVALLGEIAAGLFEALWGEMYDARPQCETCGLYFHWDSNLDDKGRCEHCAIAYLLASRGTAVFEIASRLYDDGMGVQDALDAASILVVV